MIAGCEDWDEIEDYGKAKESVLKSFLNLDFGIPSHQTFSRVFSLIDPNAFQKILIDWVQSIRDPSLTKFIAIDGKEHRRSFDRANQRGNVRVLSAFSSAQKLVLGQVKTNDDSNEITAIPELLKLLSLEDCVVSIDAIGTQKEIVKAIREKGADYVLCVKGNQGTLEKAVIKQINDIETGKNISEKIDVFETPEEKSHGRKEVRRVVACEAPLWKTEMVGWLDLQTVAMFESERLIDGKLTIEKRYYISSLPLSAENIYISVRSHWGIENSVHHVLDVTFNEDQCRKRNGHASFNFSILRKLTLNLLQMEKTPKTSIKIKRKMAGWDDRFLLKVLGFVKGHIS